MTEWTEQDSLRLTAFLVLDGHRLRLTREEKRAVVLLAREMGLTREQAAHRCGVKHHTFVQWALRTGVEYPLPAQTVEAWARAYVGHDGTDDPAAARRHRAARVSGGAR